MRSLRSVADARQRAAGVLPRVVYDYLEGGADDEVTLRANRLAFERIAFRPRMAVHVPAVDLETTVLGTKVSLPLLLAPCGIIRLVHPDAEPGVAAAAAAAGTISILSTNSGRSLEDVAAATGGPKWFQLYFLGERSGAERLIDRARSAGYSALVVTVDTAVAGNRERDAQHGVRSPLTPSVANAVQFAPQLVRRPRWLYRFLRDGMPLGFGNAEPEIGSDGKVLPLAPPALAKVPPTWDDFRWIKEQWPGPLVVKGVLTGEDARRAADVGADAVVVSNHGGRQLDSTPPAISMLEEVLTAVGGEVEVLVDGGIERGSDVVKALALGARAVLVGRSYVYGLAVAGEMGVLQILNIFREEMERTMRLLGCGSVGDLDASWIETFPVVR